MDISDLFAQTRNNLATRGIEPVEISVDSKGLHVVLHEDDAELLREVSLREKVSKNLIKVATLFSLLWQRVVLLAITRRHPQLQELRNVDDRTGLGLDGQIAYAVWALNEAGIRTTNSCAGHYFHGAAYPWIRVEPHIHLTSIVETLPGEWDVYGAGGTNELTIAPAEFCCPPAFQPGRFYGILVLGRYRRQLSDWAKMQLAS